MVKRISVIIDSCAWNYLFDNEVDLLKELPKENFILTMPRELEIEISSIPTTGKCGTDKTLLKRYIEKSIESNKIMTTSTFGFASEEPDGSLSLVQVFGGFDQGTFQSEEDAVFYALDEIQNCITGKKVRTSGLGVNQADAAIAVRSFESIILTNEDKNKSGPLRIAKAMNGKVAYLSDFTLTNKSLANWIKQIIKEEDI